jgi:hypothetical protein
MESGSAGQECRTVQIDQIILIFFRAGRGQRGLQEYKFFMTYFAAVHLKNPKYQGD